MGLKPAPKVSSGEAIDLKPLLGKAIALRVNGKRNVQTKFGERPLAEVTILLDGQQEPLEGVLFQSYFTALEENEWYAGIVTRKNSGTFERWALDATKLTRKQTAALEKQLAVFDSDIPF